MKKRMKILQFKVLIEQDEDGWFIASVPAIPGCHTQGKSYEEAIELCLEVAKEDKSYSEKIDWSETGDDKTRFIGVTAVPIKFAFSA